MPEIITSRKNDWIKMAVRLASEAAFRREQEAFLVEGARLCEDAARSGCRVRCLFYTEQAQQRYASYLMAVLPIAERVFQVAEHVAALLAETKSSQGIFCICECPETPLNKQLTGRRCLALENIQDPGNMGTILRTAEALGLDELILAGQCCDVYSPKVLRASMGAVFRLTLHYTAELAQTFSELKDRGYACYAAVPRANAQPVTALDFTVPSVVAVGNEGNGLRPETIAAATGCVVIPMEGRAESLNASASAAILMWEMMRKE